MLLIADAELRRFVEVRIYSRGGKRAIGDKETRNRNKTFCEENTVWEALAIGKPDTSSGKKRPIAII